MFNMFTLSSIAERVTRVLIRDDFYEFVATPTTRYEQIAYSPFVGYRQTRKSGRMSFRLVSWGRPKTAIQNEVRWNSINVQTKCNHEHLHAPQDHWFPLPVLLEGKHEQERRMRQIIAPRHKCLLSILNNSIPVQNGVDTVFSIQVILLSWIQASL